MKIARLVLACAAVACIPASAQEFTIRGLRLGMTLAELEAKLGTEVVEIRPERKPGWKLPEFAAYEETLRLSDGAKFTAAFSSPVSGGLGTMVMYEQTLRDGPSPEKMLEDLGQRYGAPDERGASGYWLTWHMKSRVPARDNRGAFLKVHFRTGQDGKVDYFRAVLNDYAFLRDDEQKASVARREANIREAEKLKSNAVKF